MKVLTESKEKVKLPGTFLVHYAREISLPRQRWN